jgi:tetratricopeptide (TPR) repeat protein
LANEIESPRGLVPKPAQARLRYAYAALLLEQGDRDAAQDWFTAAARIDPEGTDALDRLDELNGFVLITDFDDDDEDSDVVADDDDDDEESDVVADDDEDSEDESDDTQAIFGEQDDELPSEEDDVAEVVQEIEEADVPDANPEGSAS